jgi:hypothetical protein
VTGGITSRCCGPARNSSLFGIVRQAVRALHCYFDFAQCRLAMERRSVMRQQEEQIFPRPGKALNFLVGGLGVAYLGIGGLIVWAYSTGWSSGRGIRLYWNHVPAELPWLVPGLLLVLSAGYVRQCRWAAVLATGIFGLSAAAAVALLVMAMFAVRAVPIKVAVVSAVVVLWLLVLWAGLSELRRQWAWLGAAALPAGPGFPLDGDLS